MTFETLAQARSGVSIAFEKRHHYLQLPSGKWTRTLGVPASSEVLDIVHIRGRIYRATFTTWGARIANI